jgi:hypothetical protein
MLSFSTRPLQAYVTTGLIADQYNPNVDILGISLH